MTDESRPMGRMRLLALVVLVATFIAGALVGIASQQVLGADEPDRREHRRDSRQRDLFGAEGVLTRRLELTEAQRTEIERLLAEDREKADSIFREMRPALKARYDSTTARIREVLDAEQQAEFDRYRQERRERMRVKYRVNHDGRQDEGR